VSAADDLHTWLDARRLEVERALDLALPSPPACPSQLFEAMRYSLLAGGKRLRPMLALAAAEAVDPGRPDRARVATMAAACALELIHTYSLVHDDLPAMDDDTLRRGRPTNHVVYGEGVAILAGDGLLTEAFVHLTSEPREVEGVSAAILHERKLRTVRIVAEAAGACGMVGGQAIDLAAAGAGASFDAEGLRGMHSRKTGALIRAAAASGAVMAGATDAQLAAIDGYARELGLAFQIVDDILDVEGAAAVLGKTAGKDAAAGKPTYPALYGIQESRALASASVDRALAALGSAGLSGYLPAIAQWVLTRTA
jgi:geranylgeranyl diphosphate synthase type II